MTEPLDSKSVPDVRGAPDKDERAPQDHGAPAELESAPATPPRTRTSAAWVATCVGTVILVALIVFIAQNTRRVDVSFLGWNGRFPLSVALLVAAAGAAVIVIVIGTARIAQLRLAARRVRRSTRPHRDVHMTGSGLSP